MRKKPHTAGRPRTLPLLSLLALLSWASPLVSCAHAQKEHAEWLEPCALGGSSVQALCGSYDVWENRKTRAGRKIALNVVVLPALGDTRQPDPVFYLHGGPGAGATTAANSMRNSLASVHEHRDLVFVDLRGTGESNPLNCRKFGPEAPLQDYFSELFPDDYVRDCRDRQDADVAHYTVVQAMDDLDEIRVALGYDQINLYGGSGGTRAAQVYLRRHEAARAVVMKGVVPMDMEIPLPFAKALDNGIEALISACETESACQRAYPTLREDWALAKKPFDDGPVEAEVTHPGSGKRERVKLDRGVFADGVRHILYTVDSSRQLPGMISLAARGDYDLFAQRELQQALVFQQLISLGSFISSTCAEDVQFITEADIERATAGTFLGDYRARRQLAACAIWGTGRGIDPSFQEPVESNVPSLLISGAYDPATPSEGGDRVVEHLSRGRHVIFPNQSHGYANPACESQLVASFIDSADPDALDTSCVARTRRPPFDTSIGRR